MPFTTPEGVEVGVDATDVDLEVSVLVEAKASSGRAISVASSDVLVHCLLNASPIEKMVQGKDSLFML